MSVRIKSDPDASSGADRADDVEMSDPHVAMSAELENEDEDDEVVREFEVFLSPELTTQLHMIQFPLQHQTMPAPNAARIRPRHCQMELEYQTPEDIQLGGQFAMLNRTYSSHTVPISTHLALGKMVNNDEDGVPGLHLVPLKRILQMRPSFHHVDEAAMYAMATTDAEAAQQLEKQQSSSSKERQPVGLQKKESERAAMQRKSSYAYKKASEDSEIWQPLEVYGPDEPKSIETMQAAVCSNPSDNLLVLSEEVAADGDPQSMNARYMQSLNYLPLSQKPQAVLEEGADELSKLCAKLVRMMDQGWPMPYSILRNQFPSSVSDETLFQALGTCAFLVRGNFVLHSKYLPLIPKVAEARTFILFILQTLEFLHRGRLEQVFQDDNEVPSEALTMLLKQVAQRCDEGWKLKVEDDFTFPEKYPNAVQVHLNFWVEQISRFRPFLDKYRQAPSVG